MKKNKGIAILLFAILLQLSSVGMEVITLLIVINGLGISIYDDIKKELHRLGEYSSLSIHPTLWKVPTVAYDDMECLATVPLDLQPRVSVCNRTLAFATIGIFSINI